jgi:hypothetical protein
VALRVLALRVLALRVLRVLALRVPMLRVLLSLVLVLRVLVLRRIGVRRVAVLGFLAAMMAAGDHCGRDGDHDEGDHHVAHAVERVAKFVPVAAELVPGDAQARGPRDAPEGGVHAELDGRHVSKAGGQ